MPYTKEVHHPKKFDAIRNAKPGQFQKISAINMGSVIKTINEADHFALNHIESLFQCH